MKRLPYDVIVIGAGFAGGVFARVMADSGKNVLILEKRQHTAGNAYDEKVGGIYIHTYGPHIFHTNNAGVFTFLKRFSKWYTYKHRVVGKINGKFVPIPFNFTSIDMLFDETAATVLKTKLTDLFGSGTRISVFDLTHHNNSDISCLGRFIYDNVFVNYTAKQWGVAGKNIDVSVINRVPVIIGYGNEYFSDTIQMMPKKGFTHLFAKMLDSKNITIKLGINAKEKIRLDFENRKILFENSEYNGIVFFTGAIDEFLDYKYGRLPYRSLDLVFETKDINFFQPNSVVNYPNDEAWTRITEFKYFLPNPLQNTMNRTIILKEYPIQYSHGSSQEPYYPVINDESTSIYNEYAKAVEVFDHLYLCGRLAEYKYYNMDTVIAGALKLAEKIIKISQSVSDKFMLIKQIFLYGIIGASCAGLDSVIFMFLRMMNINLYISNCIGVHLGMLSSFLLNAFINFRTKDRLRMRAIRFFSVGYCGLLISTFVMYFGVLILNFSEIAVKITSVFIIAVFQFTFNKIFTFKRTNYG